MSKAEKERLVDSYENPELKRIFRGHKGPVLSVAVHPEM